MDDKEDLLKIKQALSEYSQDEVIKKLSLFLLIVSPIIQYSFQFICDEFINYDEECDDDEVSTISYTNGLYII